MENCETGVIKKTKKGYYATTESGRRLSKRPKSREAALEQLYAVEMSQARRAVGGQRPSKRARRRVSRETYGRYAP